MLILRPIERRDLDDLVELARQLDSVNLPSDRDFLTRRIEHSLHSFEHGHAEDGTPGTYVFVMEDPDEGRCIGTSMVLAKNGYPGNPYYWLEVSEEERRSTELDKRFVHQRLRLRHTEDGPSEIGGLILDPAYRRHPMKCGKALSVVRFVYISLHPERFEREVIAEMLSPFESSGENLLWEAFGRKFTDMTYREADRLSGHDKQFIADLFPRDPVYTRLFPEKVQETIGRPNDTAVAAVRILEKVGFHYLNQVDPFDGGPYYGASRDAIRSVGERRELVLPGQPRTPPATHDDGPPKILALVSAEGDAGLRSVVVPLDPDGAPYVSVACRDALGVQAGDRVSVTPLP